MSYKAPVCLSIAGSDSGGNAGIQADLRTFTALNCHGTSAVTCMTAQNPRVVMEVIPAPANFVARQLTALLEYFDVKAIKTGMLYDAEIIDAIAEILEQHSSIPLIVDPVMMSSSGSPLLREDAIKTLENKILPMASLITPNLDEAELLIGEAAQNKKEMFSLATKLADRFNTSVLLKGGHLPGNHLVDVLLERNKELVCIENQRIQKIDTHGSGCTLSAAITANIGHEMDIRTAVMNAIAYINKAMSKPLELSSEYFINHFHNNQN